MAVHLDHNATTPLRPEARAELLRQLDALGGNPSSLHASGRRARILPPRPKAARASGRDDSRAPSAPPAPSSR